MDVVKGTFKRNTKMVFNKWLDGELPIILADDYIDDFYRDALKPAKNNMRLLEVFMLLAVLISLLVLIGAVIAVPLADVKGGKDQPC